MLGVQKPDSHWLHAVGVGLPATVQNRWCIFVCVAGQASCRTCHKWGSAWVCGSSTDKTVQIKIVGPFLRTGVGAQGGWPVVGGSPGCCWFPAMSYACRTTKEEFFHILILQLAAGYQLILIVQPALNTSAQEPALILYFKKIYKNPWIILSWNEVFSGYEWCWLEWCI